MWLLFTALSALNQQPDGMQIKPYHTLSLLVPQYRIELHSLILQLSCTYSVGAACQQCTQGMASALTWFASCIAAASLEKAAAAVAMKEKRQFQQVMHDVSLDYDQARNRGYAHEYGETRIGTS